MKTNMNKYIYISIICIIIIFIIYILVCPIQAFSYYYTGKVSDANMSEPIKNGEIISQNILIKTEELNSIDLKFGKETDDKDKIKITILGLNNDTNFEQIINVSDIGEGFYNIKIPRQKNMKNKIITIQISYYEYSGKHKLSYIYTTTKYKYNVMVDGKETNNPMLVCINGKNRDITLIWYPMMLLAIVISIFSLNGGSINEKKCS